MSWETIPVLVLSLCAFGYAGYRLALLYRLMTTLERANFPTTDRLFLRLRGLVTEVLGQRRILRKIGPGVMHLALFWGFVVLSFGTLEQFAATVFRSANFQFIGHAGYLGFVFLQDFFTGAVLLALGYAAFRRYLLRPEALGKSRDAGVILGFIASLMFSILLMNAFRLLATAPWYAGAMPLSSRLAASLGHFSFSVEMNQALATGFKWIHLLLVLGFAAYIPGSKHLHILAAGPNVLLRPLDYPAPPAVLNFDKTGCSQFGIAKTSDLNWKDALDLYSCSECGRCQDVCPAFASQKPLSPKMLILDLKESLSKNRRPILAGRKAEVSPIIDSEITDEAIWSCTFCRACESVCPTQIQHTDKILGVRRDLTMMQSRFPVETQSMFRNLETYGSPWPFGPSDRMKWAEGLQVKTVAQEPNPEILLWVGCAGAFDDRYRKVIRALANILRKAGIKFAVLGEQERCTGDAARRAGNEYLFQSLAKANIDTLNGHKVKRILTACPHCFNTIQNEYPELGGEFEVIHHTDFLAQLISQGRIKPAKGSAETITYHDSCYLGRWNGIYDSPRAILRSLPAVRMVEITDHREGGKCCGAGGARMWMEEKGHKRMNEQRTEQATATRAGVVATACPFCMTMLGDGLKARNIDDKVRTMDLAELVDQASS